MKNFSLKGFDALVGSRGMMFCENYGLIALYHSIAIGLCRNFRNICEKLLRLKPPVWCKRKAQTTMFFCFFLPFSEKSCKRAPNVGLGGGQGLRRVRPWQAKVGGSSALRSSGQFRVGIFNGTVVAATALPHSSDTTPAKGAAKSKSEAHPTSSS